MVLLPSPRITAGKAVDLKGRAALRCSVGVKPRSPKKLFDAEQFFAGRHLWARQTFKLFLFVRRKRLDAFVKNRNGDAPIYCCGLCRAQ